MDSIPPMFFLDQRYVHLWFFPTQKVIPPLKRKWKRRYIHLLKIPIQKVTYPLKFSTQALILHWKTLYMSLKNILWLILENAKKGRVTFWNFYSRRYVYLCFGIDVRQRWPHLWSRKNIGGGGWNPWTFLIRPKSNRQES